MESYPEIKKILKSIKSSIDLDAILDGCDLYNPPKASTFEEIAGVGIFLMEECREGKELFNLLDKYGISPPYSTTKVQDHFDEAAERFIEPALNFIEDKLQQLRESKVQKIASENKLVLQLMSEVDRVNILFKKQYGFNLIKVEEQRTWGDLLRPCLTEDEFNKKMSCLSNLLDWINVKGIKGLIQKPLEDREGSINLLEAFLEEEYPSYDPNIIKRIRRIKRIRKKYPTHKDTPEVMEALKEIGDYPPKDWQQFWDRILTDFLLSLVQIREYLQGRSATKR